MSLSYAIGGFLMKSVLENLSICKEFAAHTRQNFQLLAKRVFNLQPRTSSPIHSKMNTRGIYVSLSCT